MDPKKENGLGSPTSDSTKIKTFFKKKLKLKLKQRKRLSPLKAITEAKDVSINTIIMLNEIIIEYFKVHALK
jgi:hypothetical protein